MSQLLLTRSPYRQELKNSPAHSFRRTRVTPMKWKFEFGPMTAIVGLAVVAVGIFALYLAHFNQVATKGYVVKRLEVDRQQLEEQNQLRSMNLARVQSMNTILHSSRIQTMVNSNNLSFVRGDTALAKADVGT